MITAVIPLRLSRDNLYDEIGRLERIAEEIPREEYKLLIVDYGTCESRVEEVSALKEKYSNVEIVRVDEYGAFNIGRARDIGVQESESDIIMLHDIDFLCSEEVYKKIHKEAERRNFHEKCYDYFTVPTIFLTEYGTNRYLEEFNKNSSNADWGVHNSVLRGDQKFFRHIALGSSALVINRYFYLFSGGHDRSFSGHGAEDFEFYHRLEAICARAPRPNKYYDNIPYSPGEFQGFRSFFALFGQDVFMRGISMVHLDHPRREVTDRSYHQTSRNFRLLRRRMEEFDRGSNSVAPLSDLRIREKTLLLMSALSMPAKALRGALPALGDYQFLPEDAFREPSDLINFIEREQITQTVFLNPFGNDGRAVKYREIRSRGLRTIAFDRGALPDSWFFDRQGFLASSEMYSGNEWDHPLSGADVDKVRNYISSLRENEKHLEKNDMSMGASYWRNRLGIGRRKVIFVAFQRPRDVATRFFGGPVGNFENFVSWISELVGVIDPTQYVVVAKVHPLEIEAPVIDGVTWCPAGANIHDLIDLCEKMIVINSGSGLIGAAFGKPVIVCGDAFYAHPGLCWNARNISELSELCHQALVADKDKVERFIYYLISEAYSFGESRYAEVMSDGAKTKIANEIEFSVIRGLTNTDIVLGRRLERLPNEAFLLTSAGRKVRNVNKLAASGNQHNLGRASHNFSGFRRLVWSVYVVLSGPFQGKDTRRKMKEYPIEFLTQARHPANRYIGKLILSGK